MCAWLDGVDVAWELGWVRTLLVEGHLLNLGIGESLGVNETLEGVLGLSQSAPRLSRPHPATAATPSDTRPLSFFDGFAYSRANLAVIAAQASMLNLFPILIRASAGKNYLRHRAHFAGLLRKAGRVLEMWSVLA